MGIVDAELYTGLGTGFRQLSYGVAIERCVVHDVVIADPRIIHGEAVMMFGRDDDVFHAGLLGQCHPLLGIEIGRVECGRDCPVFLHRDLELLHDPLRYIPLFYSISLPFAPEYGIGPPMNEHPELAVLEPGGNVLHLIATACFVLWALRARNEEETGQGKEHFCSLSCFDHIQP